MYARLELNLCRGRETFLSLYRSKAEADKADHESSNALLIIDLNNEQLTELMVVNKMKATNMDR